MAEFERLHAGNSEIQEKQAITFDFAQTATPGLVATGVLTGLMVNQTSTASGSVVIGAGAGVIGSTVGAGASEAINPGAVTFDVFTLNPVGGLPRNDIIVWDSVTKLLAVVVGTPNATPSDPTVANTKMPLARLRHAASAVTIPLAKIDDLRTFTALRDTPIPVHSQAERDALPIYDGLRVYRLDTHIEERYNAALTSWSSGATWLAPALLNSWANNGSGPTWRVAGYQRNADGIVTIRGIVTRTGSNAGYPIFTLGVGYRPNATERFLCEAWAGWALVTVGTDGNVAVLYYDTGAGPGGYINLTGIQFSAVS